jgi:putative sterol carrier protein
MTISEVFAAMRDRVTANPAKIATFSASYQFDLTGDDAGTYHAYFDNGAVDIGEGATVAAACTVTMASSDFIALVEGKLNATSAFMSGKLKIKGDMGMAMKLQTILS